MRSLLAECKAALDTFTTSRAHFHIFRTINGAAPSSTTPPARTLFILDSSFNPPQVAHLTLATTALASRDTARYPKPHRLVLLFSSHNADKSPAPAAFEHRLATMTLFAQDAAGRMGAEGVPIDVALTDKPYYNDKTAAMEEAGTYPGRPTHVHLVGYDTFVRIFTAKYYAEHDPPFSALDGFMARHALRITLREGEEYGDEAAQREFWERLGRGEMEGEGARREWAGRIEMVKEEEEAVGVSSTDVRKAAAKGDWVAVERLCTGRVAAWVREYGLYGEDGSKLS